jgi:hypothetical protein
MVEVSNGGTGRVLEIKPFSVSVGYNQSARTTVILDEAYSGVRYAMEGGYPTDVTAVGIESISGNRVTIKARNFYSSTVTASGNIIVFET